MQVKHNKIAVLITSFNRREITLRCLLRLFELRKDIDVFLVDDNSTDGTYDAVTIAFPQVKIIKGDGNLFWNRGMRLAWDIASKHNYEFYFWLNDDVILYENAFEELFESLKSFGGKAIISGFIETHDKSRVIYGGSDENKKIIIPNGSSKNITFMNGNIVLIPKLVFESLGNLDPVFHHDAGDLDYGLRAIENGFKVFTTRVAVGSGETNNLCRGRLNNSTLLKRFKNLYSPLGSNPNIAFYFRKKHFGYLNAGSHYIFVIALNILPDFVVTALFNSRYK